MSLRFDERLSAALLPPALRLMGKPFDRMLAELQANERLSPDELAELQWSRLRTLMAHAYEHVPYYRAAFDEADTHPDDIRTREQYALLPTTDRDTLVQRGDDLLADTFDRASLKCVFTGGSTGVAAEVRQHLDYYYLGWSTFQRNLRWIGFEPGERQAWFTRPAVPDFKRRVRLALERKWVVGIAVRSEQALSEWAAGMLRQQPRFVYGYAAAIAALADHALDRDIRFTSVRHVVTTSETLTEDMRARIAEAFQAPVYNQYGCTEVYAIASECEHGSMHINMDVNHVELVPVTGPDGNAAHEIVATPLMQFAQPLLRFRTGDRATPADGPCPCGLPFPLMGQVEGRVDDILEFAGGAKVSGILLERLVRPTYGVARFQIQQTSRDSLRVLVVPNQQYGERTLAELGDLRERLARQAGISVDVTPVLVEEIPLTASGKQKAVVRLNDEAPR